MTTPAPGKGGRDQRIAATTTTADRDATADTRPSDVPAQLRRRRAASWGQRHRARLDRIFGVRDPWPHEQPDDWADGELAAWQAAAEHLQGHELYGRWQCPVSVRAAWRRRQPGRWGAA